MTNKNFKKGFTLIETMAAILLLSIALVGPMTIAQKGLQTSLIAKDQDAAFNLAQDAVEFLRYARDTNCLTAGGSSCPAAVWLTGTINLTPCISANGTAACTVDSYVNAVASCTGGVCSVINYDSGNNDYTYGSNANTAPTIFTRTVQIQTPASCATASNATPCEADVTVNVSWSDPLVHSVQVKESLYDWQ
jgi:prepilin-type N-terminal cleavage/methylation domain-containing protein